MSGFRIAIAVPASSANLGPGYDCLGIAWNLYNRFEIQSPPAPGARVVFEGPEGANLPASANNLLFTSLRDVCRRRRIRMPALSLRADIRVPVARGLGSSSTAIVAGVLAAGVLAEKRLLPNELLEEAARLEGHPDNVAPALVGGLTAALMLAKGRVAVSRVQPHRSLGFVVLSPDYAVETAKARAALPAKIPHGDAVFNLSRVPILVERLRTGEVTELGELMEDRLHEGQRAHLFARFAELKAAAVRGGAAGVCLSGAGPSMLAICRLADRAALAEKWAASARRLGVAAVVRELAPDVNGARVRVEEL